MTDITPHDTPENIYLDRVILTIDVENRHAGSVINDVREKYQAQVMENYPSPRDVWSQDSQFTRVEWQADVTHGNTNLGYWAWVEHSRNVLEDPTANNHPEKDGDARSILSLAAEVYGLLREHTESFEMDDIGADGLYLLGAILQDEQCEWPDGRPILRILREHLPAGHPVFKYVTEQLEPPPPIAMRTLRCGHTTTDETDECQHQKHEDCLICSCCGRCHESLDDDDLCRDCGGKDLA
ncbi:MAG: hypothetical protein ACHRHE_06975 [Tepidisphaerales bacterium]